MNSRDNVVPIRHHLTLICSDPRWSVDEVASYVADLVSETADGHSIKVEVFDESHEFDELRRTRDEAFRVIGTGAIKMLEQGDGWERFRALVAALKTFSEAGKEFTSSLGPEADPAYVSGEEDGYATAMDALDKIIEMCEEKR